MNDLPALVAPAIGDAIRPRIAPGFRKLELHLPSVPKPIDEIRTQLGRATKTKSLNNKEIKPDTTRTLEWHAKVAEHLSRQYFDDRGLGQLLGGATFGSTDGYKYVKFDYYQPACLKSRGVTWINEDEPHRSPSSTTA